MSAAAAVPPTGPSGSTRSTSRSRSTTSWASSLGGKQLPARRGKAGPDGTTDLETRFYQAFIEETEPDVDLRRPTMRTSQASVDCASAQLGCTAQRSGSQFTTFTLPVTSP